ncbi:MAG: UDP-N-acetylmuramoyl-tripeptide--D-alanyl-D-alanine ligase [Erysipelotrichaceae bacterium]|nr:UDP-N-acetylmuramoyl-tripeptide--D-alanyl-D-alanine ligase [Erysipelotrichaceae bacterium]
MMLVKEILEATNGKLLSGNMNDDIKGFTQDSRQVKEGNMYIPLIGENADGHDYIRHAFINGASATLTMHDINYPSKNVILVDDTLKALGDMARYLRSHRKVKVVGITGSVGKTSTKDMIYSVVKEKYKTLKTLGNYNNHIGLPLTILRYQDEEVMILEMGMNHLGEIHYLTEIAQPDIAAITNVGSAHIGEVGSRENILKAKMEIVDGLNDGILVINDDNDMLHTVEQKDYKLIRIGENNRCDLKAYDIDLRISDSYFKIDVNDQTYRVHVPVAGEHFIYNALIAIAIGLSLDIDMDLCIQGIEHFELTKNRMDILELNDITVIDGTYNANLDSMKSSLDVLSQYPNRKIAILADMLELGNYEQKLHEEVGYKVVESDVDILLCVGRASKYIIDAANEKGIKNAYHFKSNQNLIQFLDEILEKDDVILVKGSNGMHLKEVIEFLKER